MIQSTIQVNNTKIGFIYIVRGLKTNDPTNVFIYSYEYHVIGLGLFHGKVLHRFEDGVENLLTMCLIDVREKVMAAKKKKDFNPPKLGN